MDTVESSKDTWPATAASVPLVRAFVSAYLGPRAPADLVDGVLVIASELATNAVEHAGTPFTVTVECTSAGVTVQVRDGSSLAPARRSPDPTADGGRGLVVVDALSGSWGVRAETDGGKSVWARCPTASPS